MSSQIYTCNPISLHTHSKDKSIIIQYHYLDRASAEGVGGRGGESSKMLAVIYLGLVIEWDTP